MIGQNGFREAIRTATVSYPIPFIFAVSLAFALACFGLATISSDTLRLVLAVTGAFCALSAIAMAGYTVIFREGLLRSERHSLVERYIEVLGDSDTDPATLEALGRTILGFAEEKEPKKASDKRPRGAIKSRESDNG